MTNILKCIQLTSALFWCVESQFIILHLNKMMRLPWPLCWIRNIKYKKGMLVFDCCQVTKTKDHKLAYIFYLCILRGLHNHSYHLFLDKVVLFVLKLLVISFLTWSRTIQQGGRRIVAGSKGGVYKARMSFPFIAFGDQKWCILNGDKWFSVFTGSRAIQQVGRRIWAGSQGGVPQGTDGSPFYCVLRWNWCTRCWEGQVSMYIPQVL